MPYLILGNQRKDYNSNGLITQLIKYLLIIIDRKVFYCIHAITVLISLHT
jgi:hypothetical protein